jgi:hypothetical protein
MRILDDIIVRVRPEEFPAEHIRCSVKAKVGGKIEHSFEMRVPADDFESKFHLFMRIAEEEILRIAQKESEEDHATKGREAIPSP